MSIFYFWKNAKKDEKREEEGMVSGNGFSFFPYFSSCFSLPLQCFQAVTLGFPLEGKTWLFAFCLSSMNELAGGGEGGAWGEGECGLVLVSLCFGEKLKFRLCQQGTNLGNGQYRAPLP